ncbi:MAG: HlyD family efflux transporter periplasmic adaptor subunit [Phycisphaerales bacterium]|nr:HlyD family efflux transporter periplasmic adaptor subunit [Phycisphaerales bacterium]
MSSGIVESSQGSGADTPAASGPARSKLVQRLLAASENLPAFMNDLLTTQAVSVAGTEAAAFLIERQQEAAAEFNLRPIAHIRPDNSSQETRQAAINAFVDIIRPCVIQGKDGAIEVGPTPDAGEIQFCLVTLLRSEGQIVAVSAVITRCRDVERAKQRLMSMQLVAGYFELYSLRRSSEQSRFIAQSHQQVLQLAGAVATAEGFEGASMNLCNELAQRSGAARVAIGWLSGTRIKLRALSHTEKFDKKQELVVALERAMEECVDQEQPVQFDPKGETSSPNVSRAARELSQSQGGNIVLTLPLRRRAEVVGAVTLEFPSDRQLGEHAASGLAVAADLLAPQLYDRFQNDRWLITKTGVSIRETAKLAVGPKHMLAKLIIVLVIAAGLFVTFYRPMYRVNAAFKFVPVQRQSISAPFEGRVQEAYVRPGQAVKAGELMLKMDTSDLEIKLSEAMSKAQQLAKEADKYRGEDKIAEMRIALEEKAQVESQVQLIQLQIQRASIVAPIDGEVIAGDWQHKKGAPLKQGDEVFQVADPHHLRAELTVSDRDIQEMGEHFVGKLATTGQPQEKYEFEVSRIVPLGRADEGSNVFTVYADMRQTSPTWLPGMVGQARIDIAKRPLVWIWTHRVVEFVRLKFWV